MKKFKLTILTFIVFLALSISSLAGEKTIKFGWDQQTSSDLSGWNLYYSTSPNVEINPENLLETIQWNGVEQSTYTATVSVPSPDNETITYYFVLTSFDTSNNESSRSNEVSDTIDLEPPNNPTNLKISIVVNISTN